MKFLVLLLTLLASIIFFISRSANYSEEVKYHPQSLPIPENASEYPPRNAQHHGDGLYSKLLEPATSQTPLSDNDIITLEYNGWSAESKKNFDNSFWHSTPLRYRVKFGGFLSAIEGWKRIVPKLRAGEKRRVWIPNHLGYGENTSKPHLSETLIFDIKVVEVKQASILPDFYDLPTTPKTNTPELVPGIKVLKQVSNSKAASPSSDHYVSVHLTLWDDEGNLFQTTRSNNKTLQLDLSTCFSGLSTAIQSLSEGETARFWIDKKLAYPNNDGPPFFPKSNIIADISLIKVTTPPPSLIH